MLTFRHPYIIKFKKKQEKYDELNKKIQKILFHIDNFNA